MKLKEPKEIPICGDCRYFCRLGELGGETIGFCDNRASSKELDVMLEGHSICPYFKKKGGD